MNIIKSNRGFTKICDKGNSWSLSKGNRSIVSNDFANAPVNDSTKLTVHLKVDKFASRSSMHGRDDQKSIDGISNWQDEADGGERNSWRVQHAFCLGPMYEYTLHPTINPNQEDSYKERIPQNTRIKENLSYKEISS